MSVQLIYRLLFVCMILQSCNRSKIENHKPKVRRLIDTIGFTQYNWQLDSIIARIATEDKKKSNQIYKAVINPHDDYTYAAGLYSKTLEGIKAKIVILIGVAHKARNFNLENKLVFGSFQKWQCNDNSILISPLRDQLLQNLPKNMFIVHDSMMQIEHSLEAINPFLQKNNRAIEIIPILVPYITYDHINRYSEILSKAIYKLMKKENLQYGKDLAVVISNDAIHYGNTDWGGSNLAPFGVDSIGNIRAKQKDLKIIDQCLKDTISDKKIKEFNNYTIQKENFKNYQWTWCGRYSVPFGLMFANKLNILANQQALFGKLIDYRSSYPANHIKVKDLGMGTTAPANNSHWVAYAGIAYK